MRNTHIPWLNKYLRSDQGIAAPREQRDALSLFPARFAESSLPVELIKWKEPTSEGNIEFCNVMTEIPGKSTDFILIGSHFDAKKLMSVPDFEGANDSASSTGLLLAVIKAIKEHSEKTPLTLKFAFFDGEECFISYTETDGLFGSRYLCEKMKSEDILKKCKAVIILDMIGDKDLNITIPTGADPELVRTFKKIAEKQKKSQFISDYGNDIVDDHTPFQREGIPTLDIIDFEFGEGNMYWHTKADSMDKISRESLETVGNLTLELLWNVE
jgi:glutaminyl-peptide cyclotransferase